jgi:DUF1680 family protein
VDPDSAAEFRVSLRIPGWLQRAPQIAVNGKPAGVSAEPGTFAIIARRWRKGDRIELTLPFAFRAVPVDDRHQDTVAMMRGPVMLVACNPPEKLEAASTSLARMEAIADKPLEFDCRTASGLVRMRPFYAVRREPYTTYVRVTGAL